jgi:Mn-dependent DtxR family transcriptional regulator
MNNCKKESIERYLETILILSKSRPVVRCVDIAEELGVNKSSVSLALKNLREEHYITVTKEKFIYFTDRGRTIAEMIFERNEILRDWLIGIGVDQKIATEDARRIKHVISTESIEAIKNTL